MVFSFLVISVFLLLQILPYLPASVQNSPLLYTLKGASLFNPSSIDATGLSSSSAALSNPRLSFMGNLSVGYGIGAQYITLNGTGSPPDTTTAHLFPGDMVGLGTATARENPNLQVGAIVDSTNFTLKNPLVAATNANDRVYATQSGSLTVSFYTADPIPNGGSIAVLIPAPTGSYSGGASDGVPDTAALASNGFDLNGMTTANITCPGGFTVGTLTTGTGGAGNPHIVTCNWNGGATLPSGANLTVVVGNPSTVGGKGLVNPAGSSTHAAGTADIYTITPKTYTTANGGGTVIDTVDLKVGPVEGVLVSATVDETLSFTVAGMTGANIKTTCGNVITPVGNKTDTTYSTVPFGTIIGSTAQFYSGAQLIALSTNSPSGYVVKIDETDQMGKDGIKCAGATAGESVNCIKDTTCDVACTESTQGRWQTNTNNGLGYAVVNVAGGHNPTNFNYDSTTGNCSGNTNGSGEGFCAKGFADSEGGEAKQTIMTYTAGVSGDSECVVYRVSVSGTQPAGYYYNTVRYTAYTLF